MRPFSRLRLYVRQRNAPLAGGRWLLVFCLSVSALSCHYLASESAPASKPEAVVEQDRFYRPAQQLGELFVDVQMQQVFDDSKTFVDSRGLSAPSDILSRYHAEKNKPAFSLQRFVEVHFDVPEENNTHFVLDQGLSMEQHLRSHWGYLTRKADEDERWSSLIPLPHSYVVPGGRFREVYYWDSYFTMLGLIASDRLDLTRDMLKNFAWLIERVGHIPNGNRSYYLSRSQPPFFAAMVSLFQSQRGAHAAAKFLPALVTEYEFWMSGAERAGLGNASRRVVRLPDGAILNRYYDELEQPRPESYREDVLTARAVDDEERPGLYRNIRAAAESGWDFSSRWLGDHRRLQTIQTTDIIPVDLNSLLYHMESTISQLYTVRGDSAMADAFAAKAYARKASINRWLWDSDNNVYGDYHFGKNKFTGVPSLATVYPLYFGLATQVRADAVARQLQEHFLMPGGLVTTLNETGEQWDYPNGWAPLQWLAIKGLSQYGHKDLSHEIAGRWLNLNRKIFKQTGRMMEKYNVVDISLHGGGGEYPLQDGFGWTNGVALAIGSEFELGGSRAKTGKAKKAEAEVETR